MSNVVLIFPLLILLSVVIFVPVLIGVYVYRDASRRGMNAVMWTLIAILAPSLIGFIIYLLVRGNYSNMKCPQCQTPVTEQYVVCPRCGAKLRPSCPNCATAVEQDWKVCPKCTQPLPATWQDVVIPVRPKDKTLWKILVAIIVVPVVLILLLGIAFTAVSGGASSSMREITLGEIYDDQDLPESTKDYVQEWVEGLNIDRDHAYALCYVNQFDSRSETRDYYYLIYVPGGGRVSRQGFGTSVGLFNITYQLDLGGSRNQDGFFCAMTTSKKKAPKLQVTLDGRRLESEVTVVDFNPTLYTIASESDYSALVGAAGELYVEEEGVAMQPELATFTKYVDSQQYGVFEFDAPDLLLNTVVGLYELDYLVDDALIPTVFELKDYYTISVRYGHTSGSSRYDETISYVVTEKEGRYFLLELVDDMTLDEVQMAGEITDHVLVFEISEEFYLELDALITEKP